MYNFGRFFRGSLSPNLVFDTLEYKRAFRKAHPEYFDPDGILVFCGAQGQGKTLSAVAYLRRLCLQYPQVVICTNVALTDSAEICFCYGCLEDTADDARVQRWLGFRETGKICIACVTYDDVERLTSVNNGYAGVVYLIDEMHLEFNSLESKQMNSNIFYQVSQQRKQRKHIVGTSQVFTRLAKPFREQFKYLVQCRCMFGVLQINRLCDALDCKEDDNGNVTARAVKSFFWFHDSKIYQMYDTAQIIKRTREEWIDDRRNAARR